VGEPRVFLAAAKGKIGRAERAGDGRWTVTEQALDHWVTCLAADPGNALRQFAGTRAGVVVSQDGGLSWKPSGLWGHQVMSLAVSPHYPQVVFAGAKPATMFRSEDGGKTWRELQGFRRIPNRWWWFSPADPPDKRPYVFAIAPSPTEPQVVLAGVEFGAVVRSEDGGETWSRHIRSALRDCHSLKFHHTDGRWAYQAGGSGGGASFSRDGGRSFQKAGRGLANHYGIVCAADPEKAEIWYVAVAPSPKNAFGGNPKVYLYRSTGGAGWGPIGWTDHPLPETPTALVTVPGKPGHIYAGLSGGHVWQSADYGDTWKRMPFNLGGIRFSLLVLE